MFVFFKDFRRADQLDLLFRWLGIAAVLRALEAGITFFDTADVAVHYSLLAIGLFSIICVMIIGWIFKTGYKLRS